TLVFPGAALEPRDFTRAVENAAAGIKQIRFRLRSAMVVADPQVSSAHVFLVPDEGFGAIIRLRERLHAGPLADALRPELPYIPPITGASLRDPAAARQLAASLNAKDLGIVGAIEALELHRRDGAVVRPIATVALAKAGWFGRG